MTDIQNQISSDVFPTNYCDYFVLQEASSNHSFRWSSFDSYASIERQPGAVPRPLRRHHPISSQAASLTQRVVPSHARVVFEDASL